MGLVSRVLDAIAPAVAPALEYAPSATATTHAGPADVARQGYDSDVPWGGASKLQPGGDYPGGRQNFMASLLNCYTSCPWLSAPIDAIARTITAGGVRITPDENAQGTPSPDRPPPKVQAIQRLLDYCNPDQDIVQLLRGAVTDIGIYGDAFVEVVWLLGLPVALYQLDPATMIVCADEHGAVTGYDQVLDTREHHFEPHEVIHIPGDNPKGSLYGMGIAQKALLPVTIWMFTAATLQETMRQGDPPHLHMDWPLEVDVAEIRGWRGQHRLRNLGIKNIGTPITTRGGAKSTELQLSRLVDYLAIQDNCRDTIISVAGVPPAQVGIIESGNLGGGTGWSQIKTFKSNTLGPVARSVLEAFNFALTREAFGIEGWSIEFIDVDYRDDKAVEDIRDMRLRNGGWTLNDLLTDLGKPTIGPEGDVHLLVTSKEILTWDQVATYAEAAVAAIVAKTDATTAQAEAAKTHADAAQTLAANGVAAGVPTPGQPPQGPPAATPPTGPAGTQPPDDQPEESVAAERRWRARVSEHYRRLIRG